MEFSIGDKVMYPSRGAGRIIGVEHQELVDGFEHYYVIRIHSKGLTLRVPMRKVRELGVRPVMPREKLARVWDILKSAPQHLAEDFKERQEQIRQKLQAGSPLAIAEVIRDLTWREQYAYLTKADSELLARGRQLLADEMALVMDKEIVEAEQMISAALAASVMEVSPSKDVCSSVEPAT